MVRRWINPCEIVVATPAIGQHGGPARHGIADEWRQTCARRIRNTTHPYPSDALGRPQLDGDRNQRLASRRTTATLAAMFFTANQGFINFHLTVQAIAIRPNHRRAKAVRHRPRRLVGAEAQQALKRLGRDPILRRDHVPRNSEPNRQRCTSAVEDRPRGHRHTTPTAFTPKPPVTHPPTLGGFAVRANETVWPAQPIEIVETGVIIGKPCAQVGIVTRVIVTALEGRGRKLLCHTYILCLPHSDGHPTLEINATEPAINDYPEVHTATAAKNVSSTQEVNSAPLIFIMRAAASRTFSSCANSSNQNLAGSAAVLSGWRNTPSGPKHVQLQRT